MAIAIYVRKSIERENSISCETQEAYCRSMLMPCEMSQEVRVFKDNGFSGANTDREGFQALMRDIERGEVKKLIVYRLDRISRSLSDFVGILETLKRDQVAFVSTQERFDTSSPYGEMIVKILMVFAEFERQSTVSRVKQAYAHRSECGLFMGGRRPYGFFFGETEIGGVKTKMLCPEPEEAKRVQEIFSLYAEKEMTLHLLSARIGLSVGRLSSILQNPIYVQADNSIYTYFHEHDVKIVGDPKDFDGTKGIRLYGKSKTATQRIAVLMTHKGLVSSDVWLICQKKRKENQKLGGAVRNETSFLGGKVFCGQCGNTMTVVKGGKRTDGSQRRYWHCKHCEGVGYTVYAESLEDMIQCLIYNKLSLFSSFCRKMPDDSRQNFLKNRISAIEAEEERLVSLMLKKEISGEMLTLLNEKAKAFAVQKEAIRRKAKILNAKEGQKIPLSAFWMTADFSQRKAVCCVLIDRILIQADGTTEVVWTV